MVLVGGRTQRNTIPTSFLFYKNIKGSGMHRNTIKSTYKKNGEDRTNHCTDSYYSCSSVFLFLFFEDEISSSKSSVPFSFRVNLASEYG